jgi:hypothetical protein
MNPEAGNLVKDLLPVMFRMTQSLESIDASQKPVEFVPLIGCCGDF